MPTKTGKNGRVNSFARGTPFAVNDGPYSRPIFSLSNGVYRMSLRPPVAEQSARDPSGAVRFLPPNAPDSQSHGNAATD